MAEPRAARFAEQLQRALDARHGSALALLGGPGMGKTWLATHSLKELRCRSISLPGTMPLPDFVAQLPQSPVLASWTQRALTAVARGPGAKTATVAAAI